MRDIIAVLALKAVLSVLFLFLWAYKLYRKEGDKWATIISS